MGHFYGALISNNRDNQNEHLGLTVLLYQFIRYLKAHDYYDSYS